MKSVSIAAVSVLLFALLSWVALRSINSETESAQLAMRQLDIFAAAESSLHRDMLRARAGLLRNYDPLVRQVERLRRTIGALRSATRDDVAITIEVDRLNDMAEQQERWTEQFKSENALMQNSLAYFHVFNVRLRDSSSDIQLVLRASALATALLRLTSQSSQEALQEFDDRFADLASYPKAGRLNSADRDLTQALMAHASLLRTTLPATDRILRSVLTIPSRVQQDKLRVMVGAREAASEECASFYRNVLYGISLILVGLTVTLAMRLQSWARTLRRIARIEHVIADVSTRFIKVQPGELAGEFERALKELASCINADRGYFVRADHVEYCYTWSRGEVPWPENWARDALRFAASLDPARDGIIYRPTIHPFRSEAIPGLPADVRGWLCVPHIWRERVVGILAFDSTGEGFQARPAECRLFRTACDALANAVFRDVLMREHERLEETLQQIRRLDTVGAFASGIAHNFNNIVGAILGYTEMAQFQLEAGKVPASHLLEIRRAGERARDLVDQILKFGRQTVSTREEISLANLLSETWSLVSASLPERISLSIEEAQGDVVVRGEPEQLQQVILNVCNNAAQAIDSAGSIAVALRGRSLDGPLPLGHGTIPPGKYVVISVEDTGRGMDEATRERMFDPFFTTRPDGNGLGLATVREIVLAHGGGVGVHSAPGAGTRVEVWLPCLTCPLAAASPAAKKDRQAGVESIFLFETDRERLMRHEDIVAALGFEPVSFTDTGTAIEAIRAAPDRFDAAVICSSHDSNAALHVARALSQFALHAPVILATSSAGDLGAWILASLGISEVVRYPLRTGELSGALERSMSNGPRAKSATGGLA